MPWASEGGGVGGALAPLKNQKNQKITWKIQNESNNINIFQQFIQLEQVITLGTGIGAVGVLFEIVNDPVH